MRSGKFPQRSRLRVLVGGMTENQGGKELFILGLLRALSPVADCTVLVDRSKIAFRDEIAGAGASIVQVHARGAHPFRYLRDLRRVFKKGHYDAIWFNQTVINSLEPMVFARLNSIPVRILHSHSSSNMGSRLTGLLHHWQRPLASLVVNHRFACSEEAASWFFPRQSWTFVPNGFDVGKYTFDRSTREQVRKGLGLSPATKAIVHVARLGPAKNHAFDVSLMESLLQSDQDVHLLLVGDGPYRKGLERLVREHTLQGHISFLGARKDVPELLSAADIAILPSTFEGLPYTVLEAQAAGLPILVSDIVSERCDVSNLAVRIPLSDGPDRWAQVLIDLIHEERDRDHNPVLGTVFDITVASSVYRDLLTTGTSCIR